MPVRSRTLMSAAFLDSAARTAMSQVGSAVCVSGDTLRSALVRCCSCPVRIVLQGMPDGCHRGRAGCFADGYPLHRQWRLRLCAAPLLRLLRHETTASPAFSARSAGGRRTQPVGLLSRDRRGLAAVISAVVYLCPRRASGNGHFDLPGAPHLVAHHLNQWLPAERLACRVLSLLTFEMEPGEVVHSRAGLRRSAAACKAATSSTARKALSSLRNATPARSSFRSMKEWPLSQ